MTNAEAAQDLRANTLGYVESQLQDLSSEDTDSETSSEEDKEVHEPSSSDNDQPATDNKAPVEKSKQKKSSSGRSRKEPKKKKTNGIFKRRSRLSKSLSRTKSKLGHLSDMTPLEIEEKCAEIEEELGLLGKTLRNMGVNRGHKSEEEMNAHLKMSKKHLRKKWLRAELRKRVGDNTLMSAGVSKNIIRKDKKAAAWALEKHRRNKEKRAKEWEKYQKSMNAQKSIDVHSLGLQNSAEGNRGR